MLNKLSCKVIRFRAYHTTIIYHIWAWRKAEGIFRGVFVGYIFSFWPIALHAPLRSNSSNIARGHVDLLKLSDWGNRLRGFPVWEALKIFENYWKLMTSPNILISYIKYIYIYIYHLKCHHWMEVPLVHSSANSLSPDAVEASQRDSSLSSLIRSPRAPMRCRHATSGIMTWRLMSTPEKFSSQGKHQIEMGCGNHMETSFVIF